MYVVNGLLVRVLEKAGLALGFDFEITQLNGKVLGF